MDDDTEEEVKAGEVEDETFSHVGLARYHPVDKTLPFLILLS